MLNSKSYYLINMDQAIRQTTFVQSDRTIKIHTPELPEGTKVEVIVILEETPKTQSAEATVGCQ